LLAFLLSGENKMGMSEETKKRVKKTLGLCDEYFEAIKDALNDDGNFLLDKDHGYDDIVKKNKEALTAASISQRRKC
jgi:hypothetical protein